MKRLSEKTAIVTGAGSGIGLATAKLLAAEGARVVLAGRRKHLLDEAAAAIRAAGGEAVARPTDLAEVEDAAALGRWTVESFGRADVLVNNAGFSSRVRNILWTGPEDWDEVLAVNLTGVFALTQAVLPAMLERSDGTIVTVSSVAALTPGFLGGAAYGAAKAGVLNLMGHLQVFRDRGIRATTVLPAEVDTPILENRPLVPDASARATMMQPEDVAQAILFCVTLHPRATVERIVLYPTASRDVRADLKAARDFGAPGSP